jgi:hypothetical protein
MLNIRDEMRLTVTMQSTGLSTDFCDIGVTTATAPMMIAIIDNHWHDPWDHHRGRGRGNTYVAEAGGKTGALHRNGKTHFIPYIGHLVSYS